MSHFSPLLWLCAVSAAALNSFTALDPTGAYEQYLDALGENTPAIAAFPSQLTRKVLSTPISKTQVFSRKMGTARGVISRQNRTR